MQAIVAIPRRTWTISNAGTDTGTDTGADIRIGIGTRGMGTDIKTGTDSETDSGTGTGDTGPVIESNINGSFTGWDGDTIVELTNG
jgi:hypothetical protein